MRRFYLHTFLPQIDTLFFFKKYMLLKSVGGFVSLLKHVRLLVASLLSTTPYFCAHTQHSLALTLKSCSTQRHPMVICTYNIYWH